MILLLLNVMIIYVHYDRVVHYDVNSPVGNFMEHLDKDGVMDCLLMTHPIIVNLVGIPLHFPSIWCSLVNCIIA